MSETASEAAFSANPFLFILTQLEAAEAAKLAESIEPPKRARGRPPKPVEPPLLPGAYRHYLSDEEPEVAKRINKKPEPPTANEPYVGLTGMMAVIIPTADKYTCLFNGKVLGTSKHKDYWEYHYAKGDLKSIKESSVKKFVRLNDSGDIVCLSCAEKLKTAGQRAAVLKEFNLSDDELSEIAQAFSFLKQSS